MDERLIKESTLVSIANEIRAKKGTTGIIDPANYAKEISDMVLPKGTKSIPNNGHYDIKEYQYVSVNVPQNEVTEAKLTEFEATTNGVYLPPNGYDGFSEFTVNVPSEGIPVATHTYEIRVGDTFSVDYEEQTSPYVEMSNPKTLSYYVDGGTIEFTAIGVGECEVLLQSTKLTDDGDYVVIARVNVTVLDAENVPVYSYAIKKGDAFSLDCDGESPAVNVSDTNVLSHSYKDGTIKFVAIGVGSAVITLKKSNGITIAKANITVEEADEVYDFIVAVGETINFGLSTEDFGAWVSPHGFVELDDDFEDWSAKAIKAGECIVTIGPDMDMPEREFRVKVVGEAVNAPVYSYDLKVGEKFSLEHDYANPVIHVSNSRILSYRDYGNTIEFTAVEVGEGVVELKNSNGITIAKANITVTRETEKPTPEYTLNVKVGEKFDVNTVGSNINVWMSNKNIISYYDDGGCINFTAIGVGECLIEVQTPLTEDGDYDVIARMYVTVEEADEAFDYIVAVGETINLDVPTDGFEAWTSPNGIVEMDDDFDHWSAKAISAGVCLIKIGLDPDMPDYEFKVKVVGTAIDEYDGSITIS